MKRRSIFALLFGGTAAAQVQQPETGELTAVGPDNNVTAYRSSSLQPNQCPLCRTMAEPYVRQWARRGILLDCKPHPDDETLVSCREEGYWEGEPARIARCKQCSAAFWQDAQDLKR